MRLINVETFVIHEFIGKSVPEYAILSHTWEDDEVLLQDMLDIDVAKKKHGFRKIESCCRQARDDGWDWAWVDTCCIDKTSSAELSEAINSMFQWYARSMVCYVYLSDITSSLESDLHSSRWFFRGWTLQELVAPFDVVFYSHPWNYIGTKLGLNEIIESITGIHKLVLSHDIPISEISVATRMHWANKRQTTRVEDMAYSLLGIFDVNMTLLYGEGSKAFGRLQEQILRATEDHTIFLWDCKASDSLSVTSSKRNVAASRDGESTDGEDSDDSPVHWQPVKMLAQSPSAFHRNRVFIPVAAGRFPDAQFINPYRGLRINLPLMKVEEMQLVVYPELRALWSSCKHDLYLAALNCCVKRETTDDITATFTVFSQLKEALDLSSRVAIVLQRVSRTPILDHSTSYIFSRVGPWFYVVREEEYSKWDFKTCFISDSHPEEYETRVSLPTWVSGGLSYVALDALPSRPEDRSEERQVQDGFKHFHNAYALRSDDGPSISLRINLARRLGSTMILCEIVDRTLERARRSGSHPRTSGQEQGSEASYQLIPDRDGPVFKKCQILDSGLEVSIVIVRERRLFGIDVFNPRIRIRNLYAS